MALTRRGNANFITEENCRSEAAKTALRRLGRIDEIGAALCFCAIRRGSISLQHADHRRGTQLPYQDMSDVEEAVKGEANVAHAGVESLERGIPQLG